MSVLVSVRRLTAAGVLAAALMGTAALPAAAADRPSARPLQAVSAGDGRHGFPGPDARWGHRHDDDRWGHRGYDDRWGHRRYDDRWDHRRYDDRRHGHHDGWDGRRDDRDHRRGHWH
ncbi:hypothetical protein ACIRU5_27350 [Streptomyces misionensis]|uniref:hypothetical protein n=1 Tax=Streptomyces misionensis TaxID=67331 RepID=UPI003815666B